MSAGAVFRFVLSRVVRLDLCDEARRDVVCALEAARKESVLQLLYEAAHEAGHRNDELLARAAGAFVAHAAGNLADDLVDGDCDYLDPPQRLAPTVQWILQNLAVVLFLEGGVAAGALRSVSELLARGAGPQQREVRTETWTAARYIEVGRGIVGLQWQAYLLALWSGTPLEDEALPLGLALGVCGHLALDVRSLDRRFHSLPALDKKIVVDDARASFASIERSPRRIAQLVEGTVRPALEMAAVGAYYDEKTERILRRYGPGPRVHYHTGIFRSPGAPALARWSDAELRAHMVGAQEKLLYDALEAWRLTGALAEKRVIDCGCGLGGTSLLLAGAGAQVTALTVCAAHVPVVTDLALQANLSSRVRVEFGAVEERAAEAQYDLAIAVEASCYFDRRAFFRNMARALTKDGRILLVDLFLANPDAKSAFDAAWHTNIGSLDEYDQAARAAGFDRTSTADLGDESADFWDLTIEDTHRQLRRASDDGEITRLRRSIDAHCLLRAEMRAGGLGHLRVVYERSTRGTAT